MIRHLIATLLVLTIPAAPAARQQKRDPAPEERSMRIHPIREVTVFGKRPLAQIGLQRTDLDSLALKERIALSMADVLTFGSSIFVKQHGRATLSTVSFRGTSPSHTQVTWNGMRINSPMLGTTDFSMIPSHFVDRASLLHGTSSVGETGGGLGGAIRLSTRPADVDGFGMHFVQGVGSFRTFDEFLRLAYGNDRWQLSTRVAFSTSPNDYEFRNRDKKENIYDEEMNIIGQYHPVERNRSGAFRDLHLLQEIYCRTPRGERFGLNAWFVDSNRELPMLTTDYGAGTDFENRQREHTFRSVLSWDHLRSNWKVAAKAGYIHTWSAYDYKRDVGNGTMAAMTRSRCEIDTFYGQIDGEYGIDGRWLFTASLAAHQHLAESADRNIVAQNGERAVVGYVKGRIELSGSVTARWRPSDRFGMSVVVREELYGTERTPVIPALFLDGVLSERGNVVAKASVSRNFRFPTLNDLYFLPGGNPDLRLERGRTYDAGLSFAAGRAGSHSLSGSATWFDARVDDWIIWLPTVKGFFSPRNLKKVHAYGAELHAAADIALSKEWRLALNGSYSWTPSINEGEPMTAADRSVGKQLPYVPEHSAAFTGRLVWRSWALHYKWCWYSRRHTMSSNDTTLTGHLPPYFMNNISLEKRFSFKWADCSILMAIDNLFNEEYLSVLARPMPRRNWEVFIAIKPKGCKKREK